MWKTLVFNKTSRTRDRFQLFLAEALADAGRNADQACTEKQHRRRFWNFTDVAAAKSNLSHVLEHRSIDPRQTNLSNQLSVDRCYGEEVLAIGIDRENILENAPIDIDTLDANHH